MYGKIKTHLANELKAIEEAGLYKKERIITSPQDAAIRLAGRRGGAEFLCQQLPGPFLSSCT